MSYDLKIIILFENVQSKIRFFEDVQATFIPQKSVIQWQMFVHHFQITDDGPLELSIVRVGFYSSANGLEDYEFYVWECRNEDKFVTGNLDLVWA